MHRNKIDWCDQQYLSLSDILTKNLDIIFVGIHPSIKSVEMGHYHNDRLGKRFWNTIIEGRLFNPKAGVYNDEILLEQKMGITDIVKRPAKNLKYLFPEDFEEGRNLLFHKIVKYKPRIICSIYKTAFEKLFQTKFTNIQGLQENYRIGKTRVFIMASPFLPKAERLDNIRELRELKEKLKKKKKRRVSHKRK